MSLKSKTQIYLSNNAVLTISVQLRLSFRL